MYSQPQKASIYICYRESQISVVIDTCIIGSAFSTVFKKALEVCNQFPSHMYIKIEVTIVNAYQEILYFLIAFCSWKKTQTLFKAQLGNLHFYNMLGTWKACLPQFNSLLCFCCYEGVTHVFGLTVLCAFPVY